MPAHQLADELIPAIGYIRVSTAREEMISPELQRESILKWAQRTGHRIVDWVEDLDKTGRNFKRRIMGVIERVEGGEARVIAVWKYSRFGRTRTGVPANLARVEKAGGQLISATEEVDARTAIGRFQRGMIMEFNAFESDRAGEQWIETHTWRRDQGLPATGGRRFGYIWHPRKVYAPDGSITLQQERYEPDPDTKDIAKDLYQRYVAGTGFRALTKLLNDAGIPNTRGDLWSYRTLCLYMDSGFAAGYLRTHDPKCTVEPYQTSCPAHILTKHPTNAHDAIIPEQLWRDYQERRAFTRTAPPRSRNAKYPLTSLVYCSLCASPEKHSKNGNGTVILHCSMRANKGKQACAGLSMAARFVEARVLKWLEEVAAEVDADTREQEAPSALLAAADSAPQVKRAKAVQDVERLERAVSKHMRVYAMSELDDPDGTLESEYLATLADLRTAKAAAVASVAALDAVPAEGQVVALRAAAVPVAMSLMERWDSMSPEHINALLRQLIWRVVLSPGRAVDVIPVWEKDRVPL